MRPVRILVVENEPAALRGSAEMLRSEGYQVLGAVSAREGLRVTRESRPEVVLVKALLPDLNGFDVCRQIKTDRALVDVLVIIVSAEPEQATGQADGVAGRPDEIIGKGAPPAELLLRVRAIVRLQRALAAARVKAQKQCRKVAAASEGEVLEIIDGQRRRIGHELHDSLGQYLAGIVFRAKALEQTLVSQDSLHAAEASELTRLIANAISQTRGLARGLDPVEVEGDAFADSLRHLAADTEHLFGVTCLCQCPEEELGTDSRIGASLYRVAQEAVHNAIVHGEARRIEILLSVVDGGLCLLIRDQGNGFEAGTKSQGGMGLRVMEYRARAVGGTLKITSHPGLGTEVRCLVPWSVLHPKDNRARIV